MDNIKGMTICPALGADNLAEAIQNITEGCVGAQQPNQHYMYFIYALHMERVPFFGTRVDYYRFVKTIAGSKVEPVLQNHRVGLEYALTADWDTWYFTDSP